MSLKIKVPTHSLFFRAVAQASRSLLLLMLMLMLSISPAPKSINPRQSINPTSGPSFVLDPFPLPAERRSPNRPVLRDSHQLTPVNTREHHPNPSIPQSN